MAAGHIVAGQCVDVAASADAYFTSQPAYMTAGTTTYESYFTKVAGVWKHKAISYGSTGAVTNRFEVNAAVPAFPTCDTSQNLNDMTVYLAAVIALWVVVSAARRVIDFFRVPHAD